MKFLEVTRNDLRALVTSILLNSGWQGSERPEDAEYAKQLIQQILCRRAYFDRLQTDQGWLRVRHEDAFDETVITSKPVRRALAEFFGLKTVDPILPSTRPSIVDDRWTKIYSDISSLPPFSDQTEHKVGELVD